MLYTYFSKFLQISYQYVTGPGMSHLSPTESKNSKPLQACYAPPALFWTLKKEKSHNNLQCHSRLHYWKKAFYWPPHPLNTAFPSRHTHHTRDWSRKVALTLYLLSSPQWPSGCLWRSFRSPFRMTRDPGTGEKDCRKAMLCITSVDIRWKGSSKQGVGVCPWLRLPWILPGWLCPLLSCFQSQPL